MTDNTLHQSFIERYGNSEQPIRQFFAPGRVNLIGEHTDYTGGLVLPCAISEGTTLLIRPSNDDRSRFSSTRFEHGATVAHDEQQQPNSVSWVNYPLGVFDQFIKRGTRPGSFDCLYAGTVPDGAGLSSSASIEVVTAFALNSILGTDLSLPDIALLCQAAENEFVGMQCGIMDQFSVAVAQAQHALLLDCHTLAYQSVPMALDDMALVIANTNQRRELNDSAYNQRVSECQRALALLKQVMPIDRLGALQPEQLDEHQALFADDPLPLKRARHICEENQRVRMAVTALESGQVEPFGQLMNASHESLDTLFEVSSTPLNVLTTLARAQPGVPGSRLTGAGFGGCTVSLVPQSTVPAFIDHVGTEYTRQTGLCADFYVMQASDGVRELNL